MSYKENKKEKNLPQEIFLSSSVFSEKKDTVKLRRKETRISNDSSRKSAVYRIFHKEKKTFPELPEHGVITSSKLMELSPEIMRNNNTIKSLTLSHGTPFIQPNRWSSFEINFDLNDGDDPNNLSKREQSVLSHIPNQRSISVESIPHTLNASNPDDSNVSMIAADGVVTRLNNLNDLNKFNANGKKTTCLNTSSFIKDDETVTISKNNSLYTIPSSSSLCKDSTKKNNDEPVVQLNELAVVQLNGESKNNDGIDVDFTDSLYFYNRTKGSSYSPSSSEFMFENSCKNYDILIEMAFIKKKEIMESLLLMNIDKMISLKISPLKSNEEQEYIKQTLLRICSKADILTKTMNDFHFFATNREDNIRYLTILKETACQLQKFLVSLLETLCEQ